MGKPTNQGVNQLKNQRSHQAIAEVSGRFFLISSVRLCWNLFLHAYISTYSGACWSQMWSSSCSEFILGGSRFYIQVL